YLNETTGGGKVHKYAIDTSDGTLTEILVDGNAWYPGANTSELPNPHGLGIDLNGFLYIGSTIFNTDARLRKLDCGGNIFNETNFSIPIDRGTFNLVSIGNEVFANTLDAPGETRIITAYDVCTQMESRTACLEGAGAGNIDWGLHYDKRTGYFYSTDERGGSPLWRYTIDDFGSGTCVDPWLLPGDGTLVPGEMETPNSVLFGITTDPMGNIYMVANANNAPGRLVKYDANGAFISESAIDAIEDGTGYYSARGIVYSEASEMLYVSTTSAVDDCVSMFDTDLNYIGFAVPPNGDLGQGNPNIGLAKAIGILRECCPTNDLSITESVCYDGTDVNYFLNEIYNCGEGNICEGQWREVSDPNNVFALNDCDLSITVSGIGCAVYRLEKTTPAGGGQNCDPFQINVEICTAPPPVATAATTAATCAASNMPNNDAEVNLTAISGDKVGISSPGATSYDGNDYATAIDLAGATSYNFIGLMPDTTYLVRVFNGSDGCLVDIPVATAAIICDDCPAITAVSSIADYCATTGATFSTTVSHSADPGVSLELFYSSTPLTTETQVYALTDRVTNGSGTSSSGATMTSFSNLSIPGTGTFYLYAILDTDDANTPYVAGSCAPFAEGQVTINPLPTFSAALSDVCIGETNTTLSISNITNGGDEYAIDFTDDAITDIGFQSTGITSITIPGNLVRGTYDGTITLLNSASNCSTALPISLAVNCDFDFGDLPDFDNNRSYPTNLEDNGEGVGAAHQITSGFMIGTTIDQELDGQPSTNALLDGSDEDGVNFPDVFYTGQGDVMITIDVEVPSGRDGRLIGWIDWNGDGRLSSSEQIGSELLTGETGTTQSVKFTFDVPQNANSV
ncbi:MAG: hypothetical protein AAF242_14120, partial [Bacteroidota bacterium]